MIESTSSSAADLKRAGRLQQLATRRLSLRQVPRSRVLPLLSPEARAATRATLGAADALSTVVTPQRRFPSWKIVAPPPPDTLLAYYRSAERRFGIPADYLAAIEFIESKLGRIAGDSSAGALGPMQFLPSTWARYGHGGDVRDQRDSIMGAARLLAANGGRSDLPAALFAYNHSSEYVRAVERYAKYMQHDARAFYGLYQWQVLYKHVRGTFVLPAGYPRVRPRLVS